MIKAVSKIVRNGQITIPAHIRKTLHIEDGDLVRFDLKNNRLIITPVTIVPKDQEYYHTKEWQKDELKASEDIKKGRVTKTKNLKQLYDKLDS